MARKRKWQWLRVIDRKLGCEVQLNMPTMRELLSGEWDFGDGLPELPQPDPNPPDLDEVAEQVERRVLLAHVEIQARERERARRLQRP